MAAAGRWSCSVPAGASPRSTSSPPRCCGPAAPGPTVIVSPLLALMRNQIEAAARAGIHARTINSANVEEWDEVYAEIAAGSVDVLLVSPERLNNPGFRDQVLPKLAAAAGLLVIDEAHCISDWGHDFRPDYRRLRTLLAGLPPGVPVLATTATANARVTRDVAEQLGRAADGDDVLVLRGPLDRDSLHLAVVRLPTAQQRLGLAGRPARTSLPGSGIIYTLTVAAAHETAAFLRDRGHRRRRVHRPGRAGAAAAAPRTTCWPTSSRRWSRPARSAWASTSPTWGSWCTSARRSPRSRTTSRSAGPAGRATGRGDPAARPRGPGHLGLLRLARLPARADGPGGARRARRGRPAAVDHRAGDPVDLSRGRLEIHAQGAGRGRRGAPGQRRLDGHRPAVGLRRASATSGCRRAEPRAAGHARLPGTEPAGWSSCAASSTTRRRRRCGRCDNCTGPVAGHRARSRRRGRPAPAAPARASTVDAAADVAARDEGPGHRRSPGKIPAEHGGRAGPGARPPDRPRLGHHAAGAARRRGVRTGR